MKKQLLLILFTVLAFASGKAQYVTIPDTAFYKVLKTNYQPSCFSGTNLLDTSCANASTFTTSLNGLYDSNIVNLQGLQYLRRLTHLNISSTKITSIPGFPPNLTYLSVSYNNYLASVPAFPDSLDFLRISYSNLITVIPTLPLRLRTLDLLDLGISVIPNLPSTLTYLSCVYIHNVTAIPFIPNGVTYLRFFDAQLTSLPNLPDSLRQLNLTYTYISSLPPLPSKLQYLGCDYDSLTSLPPIPATVTQIYLLSNQLTTIPPLPADLMWINAGNNLITSLPTLPNRMTDLIISNNPITTLPPLPDSLKTLSVSGTGIHCLPVLPGKLQSLSFDSANVRCIPNYTPTLKVYSPSLIPNYPVCNATNNIYGCQQFPVMEGVVYHDLNNNSTYDAGEPYRVHCRVDLSDGSFTFTSNSGFYQLTGDTTGSYILKGHPHPLFHSVPDSVVYSFSTYDTTVTKNIGLQTLISKDSLRVTVTPHWRARPGLPFYYDVTYENTGSTNLSATDVTLHYNGSLLSFVSSSNPSVTSSANTLTLHFASFLVGSYGSFTARFNLSTSAPAGNTLISDVLIASGTVSSSDTSRTVITNSFDPNDKDATPVLSPEQVSSGRYIDYVVRFQNTGTDTAINIVIADTLSSKLLTNSFELISTSNICKTTVKNNVAIFEMRNIMLPDSNVNEPASHGFIRFRMKPIGTLQAGDAINNKAAIFFDYNTPVITNTAITQIMSQVVPLKLILFKGNRIENGTINLHWLTNNEMNTKSFAIEQSANTREFSKVVEVRAKGYGNNSYTHNITTPATGNLYFRLKMFDKDGTFTYSPVILIRDISKAGFVLNENPVKNEIVLTSVTLSLVNTEAMLVNNVGAIVKRFTIHSASQTISVNDLSSGVYYLKTVQGNEKVIISR